MKKIYHAILAIFVIAVLSTNATTSEAGQCRQYTDQQKEVLVHAYIFGESSGYGHTLAAIAERESFLGNYIIRINPADTSGRFQNQSVKPIGSYGVTHILLSTAISLDGGDPSNSGDVARAYMTLAPVLQSNDDLSFHYTLRKLDEVRRYFFGRGQPRSKEDWYLMWRGYNNYNAHLGDVYADHIRSIVHSHLKCGLFKEYK